MDNIYLGPDFTNEYIEKALIKFLKLNKQYSFQRIKIIKKFQNICQRVKFLEDFMDVWS